MIRSRMAAIAGLVVAAVAVAGCTVASPTPQNQGLNYTNGPFEGRQFASCDTSGERNTDGAFNDHFYYPRGQRPFSFSTDKGADSGPLSVSTKDSVELIARGTVTFHLNTSCDEYTDKAGKKWPGGRMQKFHEQFGSKNYNGHPAYSEDEDDDNGGAGWPGFVDVYVRDIVENAMDTNGSRYSWPDLYSNSESRAAWEKSVVDSVPDLIEKQLGGDLLVVDSILIQKPDVPKALRAELENNEAAQLAAKTAQTNQAAARSFPGGLAAYQQYQQSLAVNEAIKSGKVPILPIPQGSPVIVSPK